MERVVDDTTNIKKVFQEMKSNLQTNIPQALETREKALARLVEGYEKYLPEIDEALKHDNGFNSFMSNFGAHSITLNEIRDLLKNFKEWSKPRSIKTPIGLGLAECKVQYEPLGLVLVISAWNYPIYTALPQVAAAISAGNSVILKPSQLAPYTSNVLKKLFDQYLDPRFYRVIEGKVEVGKALSQLPFNLICFTGSTQTGRLIAIEAAKNLTPCILELGGKCPVIIDQSANLYNAAIRIIFGKYLNCGQTCVAVDHVYVHESVREQFKKTLLEEIKKAFENQNLMEEGNYGKINNLGHFNRLERFYKENHGGKTLYGGEINKDKLYFSPTIVEAPSKHSSLMKQEIFGPILPLHSYTNLHDLISQLRNRPKPLVFYMFSQKEKDIEYVKGHTSSGAFVVNDSVIQLLNNHLPFGGVGESGYGRYHGESGYIGFSNPKSIVYTQASNGYPMSTRFAPYTEHKKKAMTFLLKIGGVTYTQLKKWSIFFGLVAVGAVAALKIKPHL